MDEITLKIDRDLLDRVKAKIQANKPYKKFKTYAAGVKEVLYDFLANLENSREEAHV
jgi:hypothetical protein